MSYTRREIGKMALSVLPAATLLPKLGRNIPAVPAKPDSKVNGVQIGMNMPYNFADMSMSGDDILKNCLTLGLSAVELRAEPVEAFMGLPANLVPARGGNRGAARGAGAAGAPAEEGATAAGGGGAARGGGRAPLTPEQLAAQKANAEAVAQWRISAPMDKAKAFRTSWENSGVYIQLVKFDGPSGMTDGELDYCFVLAKTLGARAITTELSLPLAKRMAPFAEKHQMLVGFHGHAMATPAMFEENFTYGKYNGANIDLGHFLAGNNISPVPFIREHHERIPNVHVKDRKLNNGPNMPFGQGDTPIKEALTMIRDNKWNIMADIEFEYPIPPDSNRMAELSKTIQYCRDILAS
jgi:hypothetical protein